MTRRVGPALAYAMLVASTLIWSGNFVVGRAVRLDIPPIGLSFWRWTLALVLLLPFGLPELRRRLPFIRHHWRIFTLLALTGVATFNTAAYLALSATEAVNAVLMISITPVLIVALSWLMFRDPVSPAQGIGIVISLCGVVTIIARGDIAVLLDLRLNPGDLWMVVAVSAWAWYSTLLKRRPEGLSPVGQLTLLVGIGWAALIPLYIAEAASGRPMPVDAAAVAVVFYVAVLASIAAYFCWNGAVAAVGPNRSGLFLHLMPVFSTVLAILFLGERFHAFHALGIALILCGLVLTTRSGAAGQ
ncbi:MAG: DMT family transporter [Acetobacterales bacterium]